MFATTMEVESGTSYLRELFMIYMPFGYNADAEQDFMVLYTTRGR